MSAAAVLLTANQRLSRTLRKTHDEKQLAARRSAWDSPVILPLNTWLRQIWSDAVLTGLLPPRRLLSAAQQETVWRGIIADSPEGNSILDLRGTAESAIEAWELVHQYRLPLDARYSAHEDWAAFRSWAARYSALCHEKEWLDEARLPDAIHDVLPRHPVTLAGFDEFTPQQRELFETFPDWEQLAAPEPRGAVVARACADQEDELQTAAAWAADLHWRKPRAAIGVVLLSAGWSRAQVERAFGRTSDFHLSMGDPLSAFPLVGSALLVLRLAALDRWPAADASRLLQCPYLGGGEQEASERALLDAQLRRYRRAYVSVHRIQGCPILESSLQKWREFRPALGDRHSPSHWSPVFEQVLASAGWPGDRSLSSHEYQVMQAWYDLLRTFASLDAASDHLSFSSAVARVGELAGTVEFQPQDPGAAIQILGPLEAAGARFDHLWICGADDATWPAPFHPHPFLPLSLQRERNLPHSSPEREREFADRAFRRLRASAPDVVVSWPRSAGDVALRPSPLLDGISRTERFTAISAAVSRLETEQIVDETAPPLETTTPRGGTQVVRLQSACPFRAFADLRLGARAMEPCELGLTAADRGKAVHKALELFWQTVRNHSTLVAIEAAELERVARQASGAAVRYVARDAHEPFDRRFRDMEIARIAQLLLECAELEKERVPFEVDSSERERTISIGGLELSARIDRVDRLPDGRNVILDYKANAPSVSAWAGERPDEPQLPLYAISNEPGVAAVAFVHVGAGEKRFRGYAVSDGLLPGIRTHEKFAQELEEWRVRVETLARDFQQGRSEPDPKKHATTCGECRLTTLCRIHEVVASEDIDEA